MESECGKRGTRKRRRRSLRISPHRVEVLLLIASAAAVSLGNEPAGQSVIPSWIRANTALNAVAASNDVDLVLEAKRLVLEAARQSVPNSAPSDSPLVSDQILEVIVRCCKLRDKSFDPGKPSGYLMRVPPPLGAGQIVVAGMDPELIKDPKIRDEYKAAVKLNEQRKNQYLRERYLHEILEACISEYGQHVRSAASGNAVKRAAEDVEREVRDPILRKRILAEFSAPP